MTLLLLLSTTFSSGCVSISGKPDYSARWRAIAKATSQCDWAKAIGWSEKDTEETQREIFAHNIKWEKNCEKASP